MKEYKREYPMFSLCGLNCGLCPRHQTEGSSQCPGCGGPDFHLKHPSCAVIGCNRKHDNVEFCFQCSAYPCERYAVASDSDSFISYQNVLRDFELAKANGIAAYRARLDLKIKVLEQLIQQFNDGRSKGFYCLAANLLEPEDMEDVLRQACRMRDAAADMPEIIRYIACALEQKAQAGGIQLRLRK